MSMHLIWHGRLRCPIVQLLCRRRRRPGYLQAPPPLRSRSSIYYYIAPDQIAVISLWVMGRLRSWFGVCAIRPRWGKWTGDEEGRGRGGERQDGQVVIGMLMRLPGPIGNVLNLIKTWGDQLQLVEIRRVKWAHHRERAKDSLITFKLHSWRWWQTRRKRGGHTHRTDIIINWKATSRR